MKAFLHPLELAITLYLLATSCAFATASDHSPEKVVALTFDDGPNDHYTAQIIRVLKEKDAVATMFLVGDMIRWHPEQAAMEKEAAGILELEWHSECHPPLRGKAAAKQAAEIQNAASTMRDVNDHPTLFRPPYGSFDDTTLRLAHQAGMETVLWDIDTHDWHPGKTAEQITQTVLAELHPGAVVLMHETKAQTIKALPQLIDAIRARGYRLITMSEWVDAYKDNDANYVLPHQHEDGKHYWTAHNQKEKSAREQNTK
jgi:peptidoglycan/xylan/chitin deacetylase (PgdA/CDA1 family)